jgi:2-polyprenyl-3-methyl-5-hydroxy-6-metoxy-1,4-benzoquinol methylase
MTRRMSETTPSESTRKGVSVNEFFSRASRFWSDIYTGDDVYSVIHQRRRQITLDWLDALQLEGGLRALDAGCGGGAIALALAERGFEVDAVDSVESMVESARVKTFEAGLGGRVDVQQMDVQKLAFDEGSFEVVLALGVLPWVRSPPAVIAELARVTSPGGYVIANVDNSARLIHLLDPRFNPWIAPVRNVVKAGLLACGLRRPGSPPLSTELSRLEFDRLLAAAGLTPVKSKTFGFGVFTLLGRPILSDRLGVAVDRRLQRLADRGSPGLRSTGSQYLVLARKQG